MFAKHYPNLAYWINSFGWVEMGSDEYRYSMVRVLDIGGTCWEDEDSGSFEEALMKAERWASLEIENRFGEEPPKQYDGE